MIQHQTVLIMFSPSEYKWLKEQITYNFI